LDQGEGQTTFKSLEGCQAGRISVFQDVTLQKEVEANLRARVETLEQQVAEQMTLVRSQSRSLARSNEALEQFATAASHDLQEPLRVVTSYLQLLTEHVGEKLDAESRLFIQQAMRAAVRMRVLTMGLLEYARVGTEDLPPRPTACAAALRRALAELSETLRDRNAVVTHDPLPDVLADEMQVTQLFLNLIGNAVKFCQRTPPKVHIAVERHIPVETTVDTVHAMKKQSTEWLFSVSDNGIGIDAAYTERIFQIFKRLHDRRAYPGTGVGLAICKRIVERHGGRIWVDSRPNEGSTFKFTLSGVE
jgi:light-regulated signal transduction histidine kinase (bacteriophytochrome)